MNEQQQTQGQGTPSGTAETFRPGVPAGGTGAASAVAVAPAHVQAPPQERREGGGRVLLLNGLGFLVLILVALGGFFLWHQGYYFYGTDDATVSGTISSVAPPAAGTITNVAYGVGYNVRRGEALASLTTADGTRVHAVSPINGTIINLAQGVVAGATVPVGQPLAQVVNLNSLFITAYVEETHIKDVQEGQGVDVTVDAVSNTTLHGTVSRILPVAASVLSAIPSNDNASGNFTKVTQRVPVVIALDGYQGHTLYPGESAEVTVHIHN